MNSLKQFARKFPILTAILTLLFLYVIIEVTDLLPYWTLRAGIREVLLAAGMLIWTLLFMGKEKVRFRKEGFGYAFGICRTYLIIEGLFGALILVTSILGGDDTTGVWLTLLNILLVGAFVGIFEEFSFRGLVFGGILQKTGNSRKGVLAAAVISGLLFGGWHIIGSVFQGEITSADTVLSAVLKTCQTGIFGVIVALIYYKTRNLYAVSALHSLDDLILLVGTVSFPNEAKTGSYVRSSGNTSSVVVFYLIFTLIMIPILVKCIRDLKENEAMPFDEDFLPRAVPLEKRRKKKKA